MWLIQVTENVCRIKQSFYCYDFVQSKKSNVEECISAVSMDITHNESDFPN